MKQNDDQPPLRVYASLNICSTVLMYFHLIDGNIYHKIFPLAQMVNNQPTMLATWDRSLGQEDSPGQGNSYPL